MNLVSIAAYYGNKSASDLDKIRESRSIAELIASIASARDLISATSESQVVRDVARMKGCARD